MCKKKKNKTVYIDDGRTVYSMENLVPEGEYNPGKKKTGLNKKEKRKAIIAAFQVYLPRVGLIILCFTFTMLLIYFWLK